MEAYQHLIALGLTEYEARVYIALLVLTHAGEHAAPARIAREARVPRPKVYETLERLEHRGLAIRTNESPLGYRALLAREFIARQERTFTARIEALSRALDRIEGERTPEALHPLEGQAQVMGLARTLVENARVSLYLAGPPELMLLGDRVERGVRLYTREDRQLLLVARDGDAALIAEMRHSSFDNADLPTELLGIHTHNSLVVRLVEGYVCLNELQGNE